MISKDKTYRTRDGREVRIYATDGSNGRCVHGAYKNENYGWLSLSWGIDGSSCVIDASGLRNHLDLIEVKPRIKRTVWLNVYEDHVDLWHEKQPADLCAAATRLACVKVEIDCEEGEGL